MQLVLLIKTLKCGYLMYKKHFLCLRLIRFSTISTGHLAVIGEKQNLSSVHQEYVTFANEQFTDTNSIQFTEKVSC